MEHNNTLKASAKIGIVALLVLLAGAVVFYEQRMLFADAPYILFRIVNQGSLQIQEFRYGSFITQMVPLIASKLHLPFKAVVMAYSVSFNLFFVVIGCLLVFRYKEYSLAVLMAFYYTLFVSDNYYWTNNEVHQGIAWMFLFFAVVWRLAQYNRQPLLFYSLFILLGWLALFTHMLVMLPLGFLWVYLLIDKKCWPFCRNRALICSAILLGLILIRFGISKLSDGYDDGMLQNISSNLRVGDVLRSFVSPFAAAFFENMFLNFWIAVMLCLVGAVALWRTNKLLFSWFCLCCMFYYAAVCITFEGYVPFHTESELMPLCIIMVTPFVFLVLPKLKPGTAVLLLGGIFMVRFIYIGYSSQKFIARADFIQKTLAEMKRRDEPKVAFLKAEDKVEKGLLLDWALPFETAVADALDDAKPRANFGFILPAEVDKKVPKESIAMMGCFDLWYPGMLNQYYFQSDTTRYYRVTTYEEFMKGK